MKYFNENFYKNSYLLEFMQGNNPDNTEYFTFSLPPQSEEFIYAQRIGETKTFGGSVFEDYGNDVVKITLRGSTVNEEIRIIDKFTQGKEYLNGEEEIFKLQKIINKFGEKNNLDNKVVNLYCLSSKENKYWRVIINDFQINRSKDSPLSYSYTLSMTGLPTNKFSKYKREKAGKFFDGFRNSVNNCCNDIRKGLNCLSDGLEVYRTGLDLIQECNNAIDKVETSLLLYENIISGYVTSTTSYITETTGLLDNVVSSSLRLTLGVGLTLYNDIADMNKKVHKIVEYITDFPEKNIYSELVERYKLVTSDIKETWISVSNEMEDKSTEAFADVKNLNNILTVAIIPGSNKEDDKAIICYGYTQKRVTDSDTWDSLAYNYYGDSSLGSLIAVYNNEDDILSPGKTIRIPIINKTNSVDENNKIYTSPDKTDNYGSDLMINEDGDLDVSTSGDFSTVTGVDNLSQAISSRLQTGLDSRIHLVTYGIKNLLGNPLTAENYIIASIKETMLSEPRIKSIEKISFNGKGDKLNINVQYRDINNIDQFYGGTI